MFARIIESESQRDRELGPAQHLRGDAQHGRGRRQRHAHRLDSISEGIGAPLGGRRHQILAANKRPMLVNATSIGFQKRAYQSQVKVLPRNTAGIIAAQGWIPLKEVSCQPRFVQAPRVCLKSGIEFAAAVIGHAFQKQPQIQRLGWGNGNRLCTAASGTAPAAGDFAIGMTYRGIDRLIVKLVKEGKRLLRPNGRVCIRRRQRYCFAQNPEQYLSHSANCKAAGAQKGKGRSA